MSLTPDEERDREHLRAVYESMRAEAAAKAATARGAPTTAGGTELTPEKYGDDGTRRPKRKRGVIGGALAAIAAAAGKLKFLGVLASVLKLKTLLTMALTIGVYSMAWGWKFALGFVLLIFVHEMGHAIAMRQQGVPASAPVFIPFVGALIAMRGRPRDAGVEAYVAIGGPILGSIGAWAVLAFGLYYKLPLFVALGHVGILLNLFNLIPVPPLDGGRIVGAFSPAFWAVGYALGIVAVWYVRSPILIVVLALGLFSLYQRWKHPIPGYHDISMGRRLAIGVAYVGLIALLIYTLPLGAALAARAGQAV
jgi:Zn-dependent protease